MIEHVYRRAADARGIDAVVVATDDQRIAAAVERFGGIARMTSPAHRTGTDRIAEVAADLHCAIVVNVQGDEPLVEPAVISEMVDALIGDPAVPMATLSTAIPAREELESPHVVKVVTDAQGHALYFSRAPLRGARKHLGLYAYRRDFLLMLAALPQTALEQAESLEQLRVLEHGFRIRVVDTPHNSISVDTPEDLERVRHLLVASRA
jgi:3-deoxy-manno-octulosonate cytidylyltransferase (CMP-KDO synthetase)